MRVILLIAVVPLLFAAGEATPEHSAFMRRAQAAGEMRSVAAFSQLYCESTHPNPSADMLRYFTAAGYGEPRPSGDRRAEFTLSMCFEAPTSKERCELFAIGRKAGKLCILGSKEGA